jgi:hypothetical protein
MKFTQKKYKSKQMKAFKEHTSILYKSKIQITQNTHQKVDQEKCNFRIYCNNHKKFECIVCLHTSIQVPT